jgi:hypothetical protein
MINYLFERYKPRLQALAENPLLKPYIHALATRWEQNNEPLPSTQPTPSDERCVLDLFCLGMKLTSFL